MQNAMRNMVRGGTVALLILSLAGCGRSLPTTYPVKGTVTLDGKPVAGAGVLLIPKEGRPAHGVTDENGAFTASTFGEGDGALPGRHVVTVHAQEIQRSHGQRPGTADDQRSEEDP